MHLRATESTSGYSRPLRLSGPHSTEVEGASAAVDRKHHRAAWGLGPTQGRCLCRLMLWGILVWGAVVWAGCGRTDFNVLSEGSLCRFASDCAVGLVCAEGICTTGNTVDDVDGGRDTGTGGEDTSIAEDTSIIVEDTDDPIEDTAQCVPGQSTCNRGDRVVCEDGRFVSRPCPLNSFCDEGRCVNVPQCVDGERVCDGDPHYTPGCPHIAVQVETAHP
ncbi:MAG: hypothetical protein AAFS10_09245, partial [Myxococcota bacterium]